MAAPDPSARQRVLRRRHKHERQAVIFGGLIAGLAVVAFVAAAVFSGTFNPPFARGFSSDAPLNALDAAAPCPAAGAMPVAFAAVQLNIYNGTKRAGLAGTTATALTARGFTVLASGNSTLTVAETARIAFGASGLNAAYTVAAQFDKPLLVLDDRDDATVDVTVGNLFTTLVALDSVALKPDAPLVAYAGCKPIDKITPAPAPTADVDTAGADASPDADSTTATG